MNYYGDNAYQIEIREIIDVLISYVKRRYEKSNGVTSQFLFLIREKLLSVNTFNLQK